MVTFLTFLCVGLIMPNNIIKLRQPGRDLHLHVDVENFNALKGDGVNALNHQISYTKN